MYLYIYIYVCFNKFGAPLFFFRTFFCDSDENTANPRRNVLHLLHRLGMIDDLLAKEHPIDARLQLTYIQTISV